jgi:hypothetical protein
MMIPERGDRFNGSWRLNVIASKLPFAPPRSVVLHIEADQDRVTLTETSIASDGGAETVTIRARFNNEVYPVHGSGLVDGFAVRRVDIRTWNTRGLKAGTLVFVASLLLDQDGGSFREDAETTLVDGTRVAASLLYERDEDG